MSKEYYLSKNGTNVGPFALEEVLSKIEAREFSWTDYVYDIKKADWLVLLEHPDFSPKLSSRIPLPPTSVAPKYPVHAEDKLKEKEWFIMKEDNKFGPFCYLDLVYLLQSKKLFEYDFAWHAKLPTWNPISEIEDFSPTAIRSLREIPDASVAEVFFRRRHARAQYGASLIVHDNKSVFKAKALEISVGGAGLIIENTNLNLGQTLFLHFQPGDGVPPFNAVCEIINKKFVTEGPFSGEKVKYGVKFTALQHSTRESISKYTTVKAA